MDVRQQSVATVFRPAPALVGGWNDPGMPPSISRAKAIFCTEWILNWIFSADISSGAVPSNVKSLAATRISASKL